jgi:NTE family protein
MKIISRRWALLILLNICLSVTSVFSGNRPDTIKNLVFSGGGTWGIAYCGAVEELDQRGALNHLERVAGTSVGSIEALLLSLGYTTAEITEIMYNLRVDQFNDNGFPVFGGIYRFSNSYGWFSGKAFNKWLDKMIRAKTGNADLTFAQLHQLAAKKPFLDLYVTGTNLSRQRTEIFSYENYPDMKIKNAVRISMCVPFYFTSVLMDSKGEIVRKSTEDHPADVMIDGGVIENFPIDIFDRERFVKNHNHSNNYMYNPCTLGLRVQSDSQIVYDLKQKDLAPFRIHNIKDFTISFYTFVLEKLNKESREPRNLNRTIPISTLKYGQRVRHISLQQKMDLEQSGRKAVIDYFKRKELKADR